MKSRNIFWGIVLVLAAILLLMKQLNFIDNFFAFFGVGALLLVGIWLIISSLTPRAKQPGDRIFIPLDGATSARIKLDFGAGNLNIQAGSTTSNLLDGECAPAPIIKTKTESGRLDARLRSSPEFWTWVPGESREWNLTLTREIPLILDIDSGASIAKLDLSDLKVSDLDLDTGASTTDITLPANAGNTRVKIDSGASTVRVNVPNGVAAQIRIESGLASINVDSRFPKVGGKLYLSPDYASAVNRVDISLEVGMASIEIR